MLEKLPFVAVGLFGMAVWAWQLWLLLTSEGYMTRGGFRSISRAQRPVSYWSITALTGMLFGICMAVTGFVLFR